MYITTLIVLQESHGCVAVSMGKSLCVLRQKDHKKCERLFPTNITYHTWIPATKDGTSGIILVGEESGAVSEITLPNICTVVELDATITPVMDKFNGMCMGDCSIGMFENNYFDTVCL